MTIRAQVTAALCGMVAFSFLLGLCFSVLAVRAALSGAERARHEQEARLLVALSAVEAPARQLEPFMSTLAASPALRFGYLAGPDGRALLHTDAALNGRPVSELGTPQAVGAEPVEARARSGEKTFKAVVGVSPMLEAELLQGSIVSLAPGFLRIGALGLLAGGLIAWGLGVYLTRPVQALAEASRRAAEGDMTVAIEDAPANELGELARQFNAMTQTLRALETLREDRISHVSHDFRSPLAAVEMLADYLLTQDSDRERLTADQRAKIALIHDGARRLRVFAANVLDAAKLRAGRMEYRRERVDVGASASRAAALFGLLAEQRGVRIALAVAPGLQALADGERFDQVLANLLSNALKFTPGGGTITIAGSREGGRVRVWVKDTGSGIAPEQKARLFTAFGAAALKDSPGPAVPGAAAPGALPSAGLGLFVVKETVAGMGGEVSVESELGRGATFTVELASAPGPAGSAEPATA